MEPQTGLHLIDWVILGVYLAFALGVGFVVRELAQTDKESYFLANRSLPWWWAGASIAATTFAADTPLVVTGETAARGMSGNWLWLAWIGVHAGAFVFFASKWSKSGVLTDAELVQLRYDGRDGRTLRSARAVVYGLLFNGIILGWVLNAMVKICSPFFHWQQWLPGVYEWMALWWPAGAALGDPSDGITILVLLALVGLYSTLGGIRGVIFTDLVQLTLGILASFWFAWVAWDAVGGRSGLHAGLAEYYDDPDEYLAFFPELGVQWLGGQGEWAPLQMLESMPILLGTVFAAYLLVQSYANFPADGGGYMMQRLNTCKSPKDARQASLLFIIIQYVVRTWPWFIIALVALVFIPIGMEDQVFDGAVSVVGDDREMAYPMLMDQLLIPGVLGLLLTSLLAAFMSTLDTHINWGASYVVNDLYLWADPEASDRRQMIVARASVIGFVVLAVIIAFQIETIGQAWRWVATIGAALGIPTALRWLWWRINASAELAAMGIGLLVAFGLTFTDLPFELQLIVISLSSLIGMVAGMVLGPNPPEEVLESFMAKVEPDGLWPDRSRAEGLRQIASRAAIWVAVCGGTIAILTGLHRLILLGATAMGLFLIAIGTGALWGGTRVLSLEDENDKGEDQDDNLSPQESRDR